MSTGGAKNKRTGEFEFHEQKPVSVGRNRDKKVVALCGTLVILLVFAVIQVGIMYMAYRSEANAKNTLQAEINRYEKIVGKDKLEEIEKYLSSRDASDEMQLSYVIWPSATLKGPSIKFRNLIALVTAETAILRWLTIIKADITLLVMLNPVIL